MEKEFYGKKVEEFCSHTKISKVGSTPIFHDAQSALAYRFSYIYAEHLGIADFARSDFNSNDLYVEALEDHEKNFFEIMHACVVNTPVVALKAPTKDDMSLQYALNKLSYDGLCAYMALAPAEDLIKYGVNINNQIMRNFESETQLVNMGADDGAEKIEKIGEKYSELQACYVSICDEYIKEQGEIKAEMQKTQEAETLNKIASEEKLVDVRSTLQDGFADMLNIRDEAQEL